MPIPVRIILCFVFSLVLKTAWVVAGAAVSSSHPYVRRRPDLPQRAGHGFFINEKYVSDDDLWSIFGPYIGVEKTQHTHAYNDPVVQHHEQIHNEMHSMGHSQSQSQSQSHSQSHSLPHAHTAEAQPVCCRAMIASCLACQHQMTVEQYCALEPFTQGCEGEHVVLHEHEVCYEYCPGGSKINYPDKCDRGLVCAPFSKRLESGGGCGLQAYTCQYIYNFHPDEVEEHHAEVADHMMTQFVLGDGWIDDEEEMMLSEMTVCEKIEYKVGKFPEQCNLEHKYIYKRKGCCTQFTSTPLFYVIVGAGTCCCFMTFLMMCGCAEMQRRKAQRMERLMNYNSMRDNGVLRGYFERKSNEYAREQRYNDLRNEVYNSLLEKGLRYPLLNNEVL